MLLQNIRQTRQGGFCVLPGNPCIDHTATQLTGKNRGITFPFIRTKATGQAVTKSQNHRPGNNLVDPGFPATCKQEGSKQKGKQPTNIHGDPLDEYGVNLVAAIQ